MLIGAHAILYSTKPEADRRFLRRIFKLPSVDVGEGWLIFGLPPAEIAVHPDRRGGRQELYLMTDDVRGLVARLKRSRARCDPIREQSWGLLTYVRLPGGGKLGIYQPKHKRPKPMRPRGRLAAD